jgi:hypothetical protein
MQRRQRSFTCSAVNVRSFFLLGFDAWLGMGIDLARVTWDRAETRHNRTPRLADAAASDDSACAAVGRECEFLKPHDLARAGKMTARLRP